VKELGDKYELYGELPGIEQKDIDIEFTDNSTLTIRGRSERSYSSGTPPRGFVEGPESQGAIESGQSSEHKATVEDEPESSSQVTKGQQGQQGQQANKAAEGKFWVSERSVGEFSRSFSFPERVDQENVRASMKNGILSVVVPKAKKQEKRKITIS
jgi:HSP20 family molecular chaperone IbpA